MASNPKPREPLDPLPAGPSGSAYQLPLRSRPLRWPLPDRTMALSPSSQAQQQVAETHPAELRPPPNPSASGPKCSRCEHVMMEDTSKSPFSKDTDARKLYNICENCGKPNRLTMEQQEYEKTLEAFKSQAFGVKPQAQWIPERDLNNPPCFCDIPSRTQILGWGTFVRFKKIERRDQNRRGQSHQKQNLSRKRLAENEKKAFGFGKEFFICRRKKGCTFRQPVKNGSSREPVQPMRGLTLDFSEPLNKSVNETVDEPANGAVDEAVETANQEVSGGLAHNTTEMWLDEN